MHIIRHFVKLPNCAPQKRAPTLKRAYISAASGRRMKTPAEIRAFRILGADAVGMSTVPEVIAANHCGFKVLAFFSYHKYGGRSFKNSRLSEEEVLTTGKLKAREMQKLISEILLNL